MRISGSGAAGMRWTRAPVSVGRPRSRLEGVAVRSGGSGGAGPGRGRGGGASPRGWRCSERVAPARGLTGCGLWGGGSGRRPERRAALRGGWAGLRGGGGQAGLLRGQRRGPPLGEGGGYRRVGQGGELGPRGGEGSEHGAGGRIGVGRRPHLAGGGLVEQPGVERGQQADVGAPAIRRHRCSSLRWPSSSARRVRARAHRLFTVPGGTPTSRATSATDQPCTSTRTTATRCSTLSWASASSTARRVTTRPAWSTPRGRLALAPRLGGPEPFAADAIDAGVDGDAAQPRAHRRLAAVGVGPAQRRDEGLLHGVGGVVGVVEHPHGHPPEEPVALPGEQVERPGVARAVGGQQLRIGGRPHVVRGHRGHGARLGRPIGPPWPFGETRARNRRRGAAGCVSRPPAGTAPR